MLNIKLQAIIYFVSHCFLFSSIGILTKYLLQDSITIFQILLFQTFGASVILFLFNRSIFNPFPKRKQLFLYFIRSLFWIGGTTLFFMSLQIVPLPMAIALSFSTPLFTTILAIIILNEGVYKRRIFALISGFIGVLVVLKPAFFDLASQHLMIILACMFWSITDIMIKIMGKDNKNSTITWFYFFFSFMFLLIVIGFLKILGIFYTSSGLYLINHWNFNYTQILILILIAIFFVCSIMLLTQSYKIADLTIIQPFSFTTIIFTSILYYIFFNEIITISTIIGSIVIIVSISFVSFRKR
ncbi:DMT family transporter [Rickettsiales bacterium]|nr:DMT family transporter [Rickettsiales bacterium]